MTFRQNTEGYFVDGKGRILAKDSGKGYVIFPGGGISPGESAEQAVLRETLEETGAVIEDIKKIGVLQIKWDEKWAKTEKQKERQKQFQGDEMHLFSGKIREFGKVSSEEDAWNGEKLMPIKDAITIIEKSRPFESGIAEYREFQLKFLKSLLP
jgi:hypothetical protein